MWTSLFGSSFFIILIAKVAAPENFKWRFWKGTHPFSSSYLLSGVERLVEIRVLGVFALSPSLCSGLLNVHTSLTRSHSRCVCVAEHTSPTAACPPHPVSHDLAVLGAFCERCSLTAFWLSLTLACCSNQECVTGVDIDQM